jgi:DNA-binding response OmpR family regulator
MAEEQMALVVEDDSDIAGLIQINLQDLGFRTTHASDGQTALRLVQELTPSLIILDLMLPLKDGMEVCREIRKKDPQIPILMVTARADEADRILGLEMGADDYITKPFSVHELMARVKAILRRIRVDRDAAQGEPVELGDLIIDPTDRWVTLKGERVHLTSTEYDLLVLLASHPGRAYSRLELLDQVWGYQYEGYNHTVNTHINRLRAKIEEDPGNPRYLKTVWGVGYRFADLKEISSK